VYLGDATTRLSITAPDSLQLAGLRRAAEEVGLLDSLEERHSAGKASIHLRAAGSGSPHPLLDVVVEAECVRIGVSRAPDAQTWELLRRFIDVLLGS
jgi:hypothetical protein